METNIIAIGNRVKQLRENSGLTQKQMAVFLSVDQSLISKFEKGERSINTDMLNQLASLFCCPISTLVSDKEGLASYSIAFRTSTLGNEDLKALSVLNKIVLNQFKMDELLGDEDND